jgi:hypothetical protein
MDQKTRIELIRKGNECFNKGNIDLAEKIFMQTQYKDGLTRIADYWFFDRKLPLIAVKYYRIVGRTDKVNEIYARMMYAFGRLMGKIPEPKISLPPLKISPKLKIIAEEILRDAENYKS